MRITRLLVTFTYVFITAECVTVDEFFVRMTYKLCNLKSIMVEQKETPTVGITRTHTGDTYTSEVGTILCYCEFPREKNLVFFFCRGHPEAIKSAAII